MCSISLVGTKQTDRAAKRFPDKGQKNMTTSLSEPFVRQFELTFVKIPPTERDLSKGTIEEAVVQRLYMLDRN